MKCRQSRHQGLLACRPAFRPPPSTLHPAIHRFYHSYSKPPPQPEQPSLVHLFDYSLTAQSCCKLLFSYSSNTACFVIFLSPVVVACTDCLCVVCFAWSFRECWMCKSKMIYFSISICYRYALSRFLSKPTLVSNAVNEVLSMLLWLPPRLKQ